MEIGNLTEGTTKSNSKKQSRVSRPKSAPPSPTPIEKLPSLGIFEMFEDVKSMERATKNSACYDISSYLPKGKAINVWNLNNRKRDVYCKNVSHLETECIVLEPQDRALIPTGVQLDIPLNYSFRLHPRSGLSLKEGIKLNNSEGIIDSDYYQQVYVSVFNSSGARVYIENGDRIAQGELQLSVVHTTRKMRKPPQQKTDRVGGIGSTGKK